MQMSRVVFTVSNDIFTDQRVNKMAETLASMGFSPVLAGVRFPHSLTFAPQYARVWRMPVLFRKGILFYAEIQLRLLVYLLWVKTDLIVANDLDTLLPAQIAAWIRNKPLVYDTHEFFTGVPDIAMRPLRRIVWGTLENWLFPIQKTILTVNHSIAKLYQKKYAKTLHVVRNLPRYRKPTQDAHFQIPGIEENEAVILVQGSGLNKGRGIEELIMAMKPEYGIRDAKLLIIGDGNAKKLLTELVHTHQLHSRVIFMPRMHYQQLYEYTSRATIGVSADKPICINYLYSLPNKLFDYIMAGLPVLASDLPEVKSIVEKYEVGLICGMHDPTSIANCINRMLSDRDQLKKWKENCLEAAKTLNWEREEEIVKTVYARFVANKS